MSPFSFGAENYLSARGINLKLARECGVHEEKGAIIWPTVDVNGCYWPRRRKLGGSGAKCRPVYPGRSPGCWWPMGQPRRIAGDVLVCEGESDAMAAASALAASDGPPVDVCSITGCGFPIETLVNEMLAVHATVACLAFDGDQRKPPEFKPTASEYAISRFSAALVKAGVGVRLLDIPSGYDLANVLGGIVEPDGVWPSNPPMWLRRALIEARGVGLTQAALIRERDWLRTLALADHDALTPIRRAEAA